MNDYLNQINVKGVLFDISGGTGSGVTPSEVQEMINQSISGLSGDTQIISGDVVDLSQDVQNVSGDIITLSGDVEGLEANLSGKTDTSAFTAHTSDATIHLTSGDVAVQMSAYTYDRQTIDDKIISGGTFDPTQYYRKIETSGATELSTEFDKYYEKTETSGKTELADEFDKYYEKTETSSKTEIDDALAGKQDKLPIYSGTGLGGLALNFSGNTASGNYSHTEGYSNKATNTASHAEGSNTTANGGFAHAEGRNTTASQLAAHAEGTGTQAKATDTHAEGTYTIANNNSEHASGYYNVSRTGSTDADKTLFSVGNGTSAERHNAFEIMQNGDIFISSGGTDIKLQDAIGQGGITSGDVQIMIDSSISGKQDTLIAGDYITIDSANTISTSGLVTVEDNEVPPYNTMSAAYVMHMPSISGSLPYDEAVESIEVSISRRDNNSDYYLSIGLINENDETLSGRSYWNEGRIDIEETIPTPLMENMTAVDTSLTYGRRGIYTAHNGWRISWVEGYWYHSGDGNRGFSIKNIYPIFKGGQSAYVIANEIEPKLGNINYFPTNAVYNSSGHTIDFYNVDNMIIYSISTQEFIRDAFVDNVEIKDVEEKVEHTGYFPESGVPSSYDEGVDKINLLAFREPTQPYIAAFQIMDVNGNVTSGSVNYAEYQPLSSSVVVPDNLKSIMSAAVVQIPSPIPLFEITYTLPKKYKIIYAEVHIEESPIWVTAVKITPSLIVTYNGYAKQFHDKRDITIPLSEIFNPEDYYTRSEVDDALSLKQDELIAGDYITIDSANTISTSGLVTVEDNEVEPYTAITTSSPKYVTDMPAPPDSFSYEDAPDSLHIGKYETDMSYDSTFKFGLINENGDTVSGASYVYGHFSAESTVPTALTGYMSAVSATTTTSSGRGGDYKTKDGWRISWAYAYADHSGGGHGYDIYLPITVFSGGQSSYVIENSVEPEIIRFEKETNDRLNGKQKLISVSYPLGRRTGETYDSIALSTTSAITEIDEYTPFYEKNLIPTNEAVYRAISGITTSGITSAECQTMIDESISGKVDTDDFIVVRDTVVDIADAVNDINDEITSLSGDSDTLKLSAFTNAEYDSVNKLINFYNTNGVLVDSIDATDFIKDGMIDSVSISGTDLIITFNTESGHEDIVISLSSIFNPDNYYTKTEVNTLIQNKADVWCGSTSEWAQISGSTQPNVIYLVY